MNTATLTYADILGKHDIQLPDELVADLEVPVIVGPQCQGDVGIWPRAKVGKAERASFVAVPASGLPIVKGTNTHILDAYLGEVLWSPAQQRAGDILIGVLDVPVGAVAYLTHTEEHGSNAIGPGTYRITGKREMADEIRRVAD